MTTFTAYHLTEDERSALLNCLWVAAERFDQHVADLADAIPGTDLSMLRNQFAKQAVEARKLETLLEATEYIQLGPVMETYKEPVEDENCPF